MHKRAFWIGLLAICQIILLSAWWTPPASAFTEEQKLFSQAWRIVSQAYLDDSFNHQNWWALREKTLKHRLDNREATYAAIEKLLASLDDPFTRLLKPSQYRSLQGQGADAYIPDLRNNPGGLVEAGIAIARLWLDSGTVRSTVNRQGMLG